MYTADDGSPLYTLPVIHDPMNGRTVVESSNIAKYLDATYPGTQVLFPKGTAALHEAFRASHHAVHVATWALVCCPVWHRLNERSQVFYRSTREADEGKALEEIRTEKEWEVAQAAYEKLAAWLDANGDGQDAEWVMGTGTVCFADVRIASCLMWAKTALGEESHEWKRICGWNEGRWKRIADNFKQYAHVDL